MCVIFLATKIRPTEEMVDRAWSANSHGGGVAWREGDRVVWRKGLEKDAIERLCLEDAPLPFAAHFRVASVGGIRPELTHPFPVMKDAPLELEGSTTGAVLFHNGHWSDWQNSCLTAALYGKGKAIAGPWSDSRALAWLSTLYGGNINEFIKDQRILLFSPNKINIYGGTGWTQINDVWCSNDYFMKKHSVYTSQTWCKNVKCARRDFDSTGYCPACRREFLKVTDADGSGGSQTVIPFQARVALPSLVEVKRLYQQDKISKTLMKKIQKCYLKMHDKDTNVSKRALERLQRLSQAIPSYRG